MKHLNRLFVAGMFGLCATSVFARTFDIASGSLDAALDAYQAQSGIVLMIPNDAIRGAKTNGVKGDISSDQALVVLLRGTGFSSSRDKSGVVAIVRNGRSSNAVEDFSSARIAAAPAPSVSSASLETVTVTSSKIGGDVQNIPIAITALSQEQLTATQTTGGPDLIKQVPNMTFTKTNFTGYSIQIRGIGTQAISVTTDPAVAVAFNDVPFIRNHFFEQEFYDVSQVEVLRGPQGTLYGRNATAGVVNLTSAKPTDQFEAMASAEIGNYGARRLEGMVNVPIVDDRFDIRVAGEWTKRQGYSFNELTDKRIDGRDLWSGRASVGFKPTEDLQVNFVWEHFSEDDDRLRSSKQLCKNAPTPTELDGQQLPPLKGGYQDPGAYLSQGCLPVSLYSPEAYEVPNGYSLPFILGLGPQVKNSVDPYSDSQQSRNLRVIESTLPSIYKAKNDVVELNADYAVSPQLTATSQTAYGNDFLYSTEDYNRFNTTPGLWDPAVNNRYRPGLINADGEFCDPQLGCSSRLVGQDISDEHAWQLSQEFRVASNFSGPLNFSTGGNYLHYETEENYYVFINAITLLGAIPNFIPNDPQFIWIPNVSDNMKWLNGTKEPDPFAAGQATLAFSYIDPNPLSSVNNEGHNYFLSQNPYKLDSYALFGETNYQLLDDLKLTGGLRWTEDRKHFVKIPSEVLIAGYGYPSTGVIDQQWDEVTGRAVATWTPKLDFTDQSLFYASYSHGYKAGGANPPSAILMTSYFAGGVANPVHPLTFKPEFIDAFEGGTKDTLLDGALTFNASAFYYNYESYQISEIVDRTAINLNFDAHVKGAEVESTWEPIPGLRFNFSGGWEDTELAKGSQSVDLMDRTAGHQGWVVVKSSPTQASNCVLPAYVALADFSVFYSGTGGVPGISIACVDAYVNGNDPVTDLPYVANPTVQHSGVSGMPAGYVGFNSVSSTAANNGAGPAPNVGAGFDKDLSGNELPNAPPFTVSAGAQYTMPLSSDWAGTLRGDFYWQDNSWARVFNDNPYDRIRGYSNLNLTLIFTSQSGWQVMFYDKNVFNTTAITGDFLNSDDSALTTNIFLTDPKLIGVRVTKNW
ncbi:MAG TPA: TonB-dependent receptor [Rhizomicrobium sp.]|jgi:iron complex outermembrane receptor protein|nr:TonB-dependent receptor [Rhizomicrobium sp.]